jgi:S-formylglutathione hydrolase FrmB
MPVQSRYTKSASFLAALAVLFLVANFAFAEVEFLQVPSETMKREIPISVTLPHDYSTKKARLPVVYLLHGAGDNERGWGVNTPVQEMADAYDVIIVTPSVGLSWYFDSPLDPASQFETFVSKELVNFVDAHYRSIPKRNARALAGLSMGGHGAMFLAVRHKDIFSAAAPVSGGVDICSSHPLVGPFSERWGIKQYLGPIEMYPERWHELSVINQVDSLKPGELAVAIDCGTDDFFIDVNRQLHAKLTEKGIDHEYVEFPGGHSWEYWRLSLPRQMEFLNRHFQKISANPKTKGSK